MAKQKQLPGLEDAVVEEIETAAEEYADRRDDRMRKLEGEIEARDALLEILRKHKRKAYSSKEFQVEIVEGKDKVKVKRGGQEDANEE